MGFKYLSDKTWSQITREERYFCSHLYHFLIGKEKEFVSWLNETLNTSYNAVQEWEISFEVCFYRDYYKEFPRTKKPTRDLRKRTFDLVLFSESDIIIIEAKVQQPFKEKQIKELRFDLDYIKELLVNRGVNVTGFLLASEKFYMNFKNKHKNKDKTFISDFNQISWSQLFKKYNQQIFDEAEKRYKK
jgi:hypothetical protein